MTHKRCVIMKIFVYIIEQGKDPLKDNGTSATLEQHGNVIISDTKANGPLESMIPTRRERAFMGLPSS